MKIYLLIFCLGIFENELPAQTFLTHSLSDGSVIYALPKTASQERFQKHYAEVIKLGRSIGDTGDHLFYTGKVDLFPSYGMWYKDNLFLFELLDEEKGVSWTLLVEKSRIEEKNLETFLIPSVKAWLDIVSDLKLDSSMITPGSHAVDLLPFDLYFLSKVFAPVK